MVACKALDEKSRVVAIHGRTGSGKSNFAASVAKAFMEKHKADVLFADIYKGGEDYKDFATAEIRGVSIDRVAASKEVLNAILIEIKERVSKGDSKKRLYILEDSQVFQQDQESKDLLMEVISAVENSNSSLLITAQRRKFIPDIRNSLIFKRVWPYCGFVDKIT